MYVLVHISAANVYFRQRCAVFYTEMVKSPENELLRKRSGLPRFGVADGGADREQTADAVMPTV